MLQAIHCLNNTPGHRGIVLLFFSAVLYFAALGAGSLRDGQETRNAGIAAELTFSRYWTVPRLNGEYYTLTPPLHSWLTGSAMELLGRTAFAARLPAALFAIAAAMGVFLFGRRLDFPPWLCFVGGASLVTTFSGFGMGRGCFPDSLQTALIVWSIYGYHAMIHAERLRRRVHWFIFYAAMMMLLGLAAEFRVLIAPALILSGWLAACNLVCGKYRNPAWYAAAAGGTALACMAALVWLLSVEKLGTEAAEAWRNFFGFRLQAGASLIHIAGFYSPWGILPLLGIISGVLELNKDQAGGERCFLMFALLLVSLILGISGAAYAAAALLAMAGIGRLAAAGILQARPAKILGTAFSWMAALGLLLLIGLKFQTPSPTLLWTVLLLSCSVVFLLRKNLRKWAVLPAFSGILLLLDAPAPSATHAAFQIAAQQLRENSSAEIYLYRTFDEGLRGGVPYYLGRRAMILNDEAELRLLAKRGVPVLFFARETPLPDCRTLSAPAGRGGQFGLYQIKPQNNTGKS